MYTFAFLITLCTCVTILGASSSSASSSSASSSSSAAPSASSARAVDQARSATPSECARMLRDAEARQCLGMYDVSGKTLSLLQQQVKMVENARKKLEVEVDPVQKSLAGCGVVSFRRAFQQQERASLDEVDTCMNCMLSEDFSKSLALIGENNPLKNPALAKKLWPHLKRALLARKSFARTALAALQTYQELLENEAQEMDKIVAQQFGMLSEDD